MPDPVARALSFQQQYAIELIADTTQRAATEMFYQWSVSPSITVDEASRQYELLVVGAVGAVAATRAGYFQGFAAASGQRPFTVPAAAYRPQVADVLVGSATPRGAVYAALESVGAGVSAQQQAQPILDALAAAEARAREKATEAQAAAPAPPAPRATVQQAAAKLGEYAESTAMSAADYVDREVLGPDGRVVALRRVAHPSACDRCQVVAGVLVFKRNPALRHPRCRCSFEPVFRTDADYQQKLRNYQSNADAASAEARSRGREQQAAAAARESSVWMQQEWNDYLKDEQSRLARMVQTQPSTTYRDWAVMTSANITNAGGGLLPVLTRN